MKKMIFYISILSLLVLFGCLPKEDIVTKEITRVSVINVSTNDILFESSDAKVIDKIVSDINKSSRTDTWDALGSELRLVLNTEEDGEESYILYDDSGDILIGEYKVFTGFDFYKD